MSNSTVAVRSNSGQSSSSSKTAAAMATMARRRTAVRRTRFRSPWYYDHVSHAFKYGKYNWVGKGITEPIKKAFFPPEWDLYKVAGKSGNGADGGKRVDRELGEWTRLVQTAVKPSTIRAHMAKWSPSTLSIISLCRQNGWIPVDAQVVVGCPRSRVSTALDLVVRHFLSGRLILLEIKTGYLDTFATYSAESLLPPLSKWTACPRHFAWIQLTWSWMLWCQTFPEKKMISHQDVMVVHVVEGEEATVHPIPVEFGLAVVPLLRKLMTPVSFVPPAVKASNRSKQKKTPKKNTNKKKEKQLPDDDESPDGKDGCVIKKPPKRKKKATTRAPKPQKKTKGESE